MSPPSIPEKITGFWQYYLHPDKSVLVAVSGGSDSVALIHLLCELRESLNIKRVAIAHVNHGLRGAESDDDEQCVRQIAQKLNIPFFLKRLNERSLKDPGIELWARKERYNFFHSVCESSNYDYIATGHTADDQAETVLFRLLRGAGVKGLRGILPCREDNVIRPLLFTKKSELSEWLNQRGITFRHDSSNDDISLSRNFIRHELLTVINRYEPNAVDRIVSMSLQMQKTWEFLNFEVGKWIDRFVNERTSDFFSIKREGFEEEKIASEGLKTLFESYQIPANRFHITKIFQNINNTLTFLLPSEWQYQPTKEMVFFRRKGNPGASQYCKIPIPGIVECHTRNIKFVVTEEAFPQEMENDNIWSAFIDRDSIDGDTLLYRQVRSDDVFQPFGRRDLTNVLRFLSKQGLPKAVRDRTGVLVDEGNKVLWIPGIRLNQCCAVKKTSRHIIKIASKIL